MFSLILAYQIMIELLYEEYAYRMFNTSKRTVTRNQY